MKPKEQIGAYQMSFLLFTFMTGSSIVNIPGPLIAYASQGAWISLLLALAAGMAVLACVLVLHRKYPSQSFIEVSRAALGRWPTVLIAIPFIWFQFHMASGIVLDIGLFMKSTMLRQTPLAIFTLSIFVVVALTVRSGLETMSRMFVMPMILVIAFVFLVVLLLAGDYDVTSLQPIMPNGVKPVLLGAYFAYGFPYVELVLFSMLLPYVRSQEHHLLAKGMYAALLFNGFCLLCVTLCTMVVLGPMASELKYSMFVVSQTVDMMEVIQRIESVMGFSLIANSFMKASITVFVLKETFSKLFSFREGKLLVFPLTMACFLFSMLFISKGEARWVNAVTVLHPLVATVCYLLPLLIVTIAASIRKKLA
ncbi:GerAB/ArcD/ProY family transporter [Paenibacillus mucilaginosus]|uniref:Spore germination protein n=1 Tax=Paenibacillus mucilaginosus (strain KNP414) TaxID=1036673 RepID=F8FHX5_PAEMK|nr:endospore germination permease [Paenibacillus mucilaginosus]AEI43317.1 spore germination protein [Paenibacillus mucilaginosus KNP414]MCG7212129.1 endospore germination permease [Paenibacillus mucilaginosus]WDM24896.1 endospore germination permease [Paenibacillus mucilaginosus]